MKDKLLYTTKELFDSYLCGRKYAIPPYQRGYKWEPKDIERLLKDIHDFIPNEELDLFYCLQNITLVEANDGTTFNVVDGQQRLTTLTVILSYFGEFSLIKEKLSYNVRKETEEFLSEFIFKQSNLRNIKSWDDFRALNAENGKDYDYQDIYYLFAAYKTVCQWFEEHPLSIDSMKDKILNHLKLIVNLPKNIEEQELFENLNGKRVPLDGADLIRALIITRVAKTEVGELDDTTKQNVLINERRIKIGMMLDSINHWWSEENKKEYFRQFTKETKITDTSSANFDDKTYPINGLYKLYSLIYNSGRISMDFFEKKSTEAGFLQELQMLQRTIENWYNDKTLYHLILFTGLYASHENKDKGWSALSFSDIYKLWKENHRKDFISHLKERIAANENFDKLLNQAKISDEENEKNAFQEDCFGNKPAFVMVSTLIDIINIISSNSSTKLPARYFKAYKEDLEHIFPQTPIADKIKDKVKQTQILLQYLEIINQYAKNEHIDIKEEDIDWDNKTWKDNIKETLKSKFGSLMPINSLGNLCLLNESVNRAYGNDFFLEKRIDIMRKAQDGYFIRPHVYEAFNKIYLERQDEIDMKMMVRWDKADILARRKYIILQISKFLSHEQA